MPKLKLTYFDFDGGRGEAIRLALVLGKVPFEDDRISREQFLQIQKELPYGALPVLYSDGAPLAQSNAIARYVGKLSDMYPQDPWQAARCDEVLETIEEMTAEIGATIHLADEEKKTRRLALVAGRLPQFLRGLEASLQSGGAKFYANENLTVADLKSADLVQWLSSGTLDHVATDIVSTNAPTVFQHSERVKNEPRIKAYYEARSKTSR
jgi:prostaglandin-H2 D-isomerase / glutathione transferase